MLATIILAGLVLFMVINFAALHTWIERKQSAAPILIKLSWEIRTALKAAL